MSPCNLSPSWRHTPLAVVASLVTAVTVMLASPAAADHPDEGWNPPAEYAQALDEVWRHVSETYPDLNGFSNYGWDQLMANQGRLSYCVRWDSGARVSATRSMPR